ncbi:hypothetical protein NNN71_20580, partial [Kluyvera sp. Awk 3]|nr:hypothetical protein [Kluyvera sp. Awk 3]
PYLYFPWVYLAMAFLLTLLTKVLPSALRYFNITLGLLVFSFAMPHVFIAPAADFRYLHFSVACTVIQIGMFLGFMFSILFKKWTRH